MFLEISLVGKQDAIPFGQPGSEYTIEHRRTVLLQDNLAEMAWPLLGPLIPDSVPSRKSNVSLIRWAPAEQSQTDRVIAFDLAQVVPNTTADNLTDALWGISEMVIRRMWNQQPATDALAPTIEWSLQGGGMRVGFITDARGTYHRDW